MAVIERKRIFEMQKKKKTEDENILYHNRGLHVRHVMQGLNEFYKYRSSSRAQRFREFCDAEWIRSDKL